MLGTADEIIIIHKPNKSKPIKKLSPKQAQKQAKYLKLRLAYLNEHPHCELNFPGCTKSATEVHHTEGRIGENTTDTTTFKAACRNCHDYGHFKEPRLAKENGF